MSVLTTRRPRKDPPLTADGKCALDGCDQERHPLDAFCSSTCCRAYYEISLGATVASSAAA